MVSHVITPRSVNPSEVSSTKGSSSLSCLCDESGNWKDMRSGISRSSLFISTTTRVSQTEGEAPLACPVPSNGSKVVPW